MALTSPEKSTIKIDTLFLTKVTKRAWFSDIDSDLHEVEIKCDVIRNRDIPKVKLKAQRSLQEKSKLKQPRITPKN